jgi:DNA-binding FadR family transcriptional regulator
MEISPPAPPPEPTPYGRDLARLILARCEEPDFAPGGRLPNERNLAAELGVTRTLVRHALTVLEAEGRISREVGRGTVLRPRAATPSVDGTGRSTGEMGPGDVMAARRLIEPQVLPLVVAWATQRDFDEMRRCLAGGARAQDAAEFEVWDFALHHAIVAASRNQLLVVMYEAIERARKGKIWGNLKLRQDSRERRSAYQSEHERLVGALLERDADLAVAIMEEHLEHVQSNLLDTPRPSTGQAFGSGQPADTTQPA